MNYLHYEERDKKTGKVLNKFDWITNIEITPENFKKITKVGRSRWMVENVTFNTLKNQGYHFEYNYGHGEENLCSNMAFLMLMAFLIDQIQQLCNEVFQEALVKMKRKKYFWAKMRSYFSILPFDSMEMIYKAMTFDVNLQFSINEDSS